MTCFLSSQARETPRALREKHRAKKEPFLPFCPEWPCFVPFVPKMSSLSCVVAFLSCVVSFLLLDDITP